MPDQVPDPVKAERSVELLAMEKEQSKLFRAHYVGREVEVLLEEKKQIHGKEYLLGHTVDYVKVAIPLEKNKNLCTNTVVLGKVQGFLTDEIVTIDTITT